ncbi:leucyl aminopeptidase family protein [Sedimentitalea todarodis]|uniref:Leucyl aminopeptidase family protein n=1 Tax=Sedimentitalea todarodis TaxID=1631240 RepID=A0ABU3VAH5_9RHOB|nr:leucyl aminopeptidase family protein [Sedimentitalea todarodis]MDU9003170.1 leucyl aminopeptidase family protein [Sedimentitalea todarodis]
MPHTFAEDAQDAIDLHVIDAQSLDDWLAAQDAVVVEWVRQNDFAGNLGQTLLVPANGDRHVIALAGYGTASKRARTHFPLASAATKLPTGTYRIASGLPEEMAESECLGWVLSGYRFDRYKQKSDKTVSLVPPDGVDTAKVTIMAEAETMIRDLVNTPTSDMSPEDLAAAATALAETQGAEICTIVGDDLLAQNFPLIHTVGRASATPPRLIDMRWGQHGPKLTLVGKGVCFDTGGLNMKSSTGMSLMKKDMGGAAHVLGIARMIMAMNLPVQLRVLIPAVENSVSSASFRPGDILNSRKGLTVENNNTDAEGRLVLADALALASEDKPDLILSMATLTGAARIAVGSDIVPFFTDDDDDAQALSDAGARVDDPVWRLPFHEGYEAKIEPANADLDNAPSGGFAGSITAALFLRRFVSNARYVHLDIFAWQSANAPARPRGGVGTGARAVFDALPSLLKL